MGRIGGVQQNLANRGFRRKPPVPATTGWTHNYVCLADSAQTRVPTSQAAKMLLEEAGLGQRKVTVPKDELFTALLLNTFPKLNQGGGLEILRCLPNTKFSHLKLPTTPTY